MPTTISRIEAFGLYDKFDIRQEFTPGINILFGNNGTGKTTLLHIFANALRGNFERFRFLKFKAIEIQLSNGNRIEINSNNKNELKARINDKEVYSWEFRKEENDLDKFISIYNSYKTLNKIAVLEGDSEENLVELLSKKSGETHSPSTEIVPIEYFPAFRTMIEAWAAAEVNQEEMKERRLYKKSWKGQATKRARDWFGEFTPAIDFPSLIDIEEELAYEIDNARMNIWRKDQELLSKVFVNVFSSLTSNQPISKNADDVLREIKDLSSKLSTSPLIADSHLSYKQLSDEVNKLNADKREDVTTINVLSVYKEVLEESLQVQKKSFAKLETYRSSVNYFLNPKKIEFKTDIPKYKRESVGVVDEDGTFTHGLRSLSSGERQIVTLLYASTHMQPNDIVLIDEPEISLHVDWQRDLISKMAMHLGDRQIIACTHSPVIGSEHLEKMQKLSYTQTKKLTHK